MAGKPTAGPSKADFIESFKTTSFCRCVELGSNKKMYLTEDDASCRTPDWLYVEGELIERLVMAEVKKIQLDSLDRTRYSVAEGMDEKLVILHCLAFYKSKGLQAVANQQASKSPY